MIIKKFKKWFDTDKFNLDEDTNGLVYILTSNANLRCGSKVMYHDVVPGQ